MAPLPDLRQAENLKTPDMKLTPRQIEALHKLTEFSATNAYQLRAKIGTMNSLVLKGLVSARYDPGSIAMPRTRIIWSITEAARAALNND